jgi:hypothetical protein
MAGRTNNGNSEKTLLMPMTFGGSGLCCFDDDGLFEEEEEDTIVVRAPPLAPGKDDFDFTCLASAKAATRHHIDASTDALCTAAWASALS